LARYKNRIAIKIILDTDRSKEDIVLDVYNKLSSLPILAVQWPADHSVKLEITKNAVQA
jgi:hypothetical protein